LPESVAIVIPARYASTRLPGKPLAEIAGKPMIQWVYERAAAVQSSRRVVVATDDIRVVDAVQSFGGEVEMTSTEHVSGSDRVAEVAKRLAEEIIVNLQGDEPFIEADVIETAIDTVRNHSQRQVGSLMRPPRSLAELQSSANVRVVVDRQQRALYFTRSLIPFDRQADTDSKQLNLADYNLHVGIYVYRRTFLPLYAQLPASHLENIEKLEQLRILENGYAIHMARIGAAPICVDTQADLQEARSYAEKNFA
jgi:3-deoxy-manno-octulosonate cytidylyltransferase (CMP-KDO synthetase)